MKKIKLWIVTFLILTKAVIRALPSFIAALFGLLGETICSIPDIVCSNIKNLFSGDYKEIISLAIDKAKKMQCSDELLKK